MNDSADPAPRQGPPAHGPLTAAKWRMPLLQGVLPLARSRIGPDLVAGVTLAALGIPEVMGYTKISGTPVVTGLYTLLLPIAVFALIGGSRHLVVAADSATAAILASMLVTVAAFGSPDYVGLTSLVALAVAFLLLLARVFKLGFLADFLSRSALIGFLTGVGVQVAGGEFGGLFGIEKHGHNTVQQIASVLEHIGSTQVATLAISLTVLALIVGCSRFAPRVPGALLAVAGAIAASAALDLSAHGIATVGSVPSGLPALSLPARRLHDFYQVLACAGSCFIVILAQSAATARAYALRYQEPATEDLDLVGLAGANAAAALTGTFVVNGSPTKTEIIDEAGGRSQLAHLTAAAVVLVVLLFLTRPLGYLPNAVLSAIVFLIGVKLVDVKGMRELFRLQRNEFGIALATAATVVFFSVMDGIAVAVLLSLIDQVRHSYRPRTRPRWMMRSPRCAPRPRRRAAHERGHHCCPANRSDADDAAGRPRAAGPQAGGRSGRPQAHAAFKEARASVLEAYLPRSPYPNHGQRVVAGQRLLQSASDVFLGWSRSSSAGFDYYVRQLRDMKGSFNIESFSRAGLEEYARVCAIALARGMAKAGDPVLIAGYVGRSGAFDDAIERFALAYADRNDADWSAFRAAVGAGRIEASIA